MSKRRSLDAGLLFGQIEDVKKDDPLFILRRATSYRNSTSRRRLSAPLDELALSHLHQQRESMSSYGSSADRDSHVGYGSDDKRQPSRQEIIAAQRAAQRATQQKAIVSTQSNSERGLDVLLPNNTMLRSSRYEVDDRMRYSYVEADGETYDVSDIIEEEWDDDGMDGDRDLLAGVVRGDHNYVGERLDRMLDRIRRGKAVTAPSGESDRRASGDSAESGLYGHSVSPSEYSDEGESRMGSRAITPSASAYAGGAGYGQERAGTVTPTSAAAAVRAKSTPTPTRDRRNPSVTSVYDSDTRRLAGSRNGPSSISRPVATNDDFGVGNMMALIEFKSQRSAAERDAANKKLDVVDELLFGPPLDLEGLHPAVGEIYANGYRMLEEVDKVCLYF